MLLMPISAQETKESPVSVVQIPSHCHTLVFTTLAEVSIAAIIDRLGLHHSLDLIPITRMRNQKNAIDMEPGVRLITEKDLSSELDWLASKP